MGTHTATSRLEAWITPELHWQIKLAAQLQGRSLTDFILSAVQEAAQKAIEQSQVMELSREDQKVFAKALLNPPEPNEALKKALALHQKLVQKD